MYRVSLIRTATAVAMATAFVAAGCNRKSAAPELQTTTGAQPRADAITVSGCLRAGLADDTFVLTVIDPTASTTDATATYQLTGNTQALRDHVGEQVQVSGTLRAEQEIASKGDAVAEKPAAGTSGTPTVQTKTDLDVKQMTVSSVTPSGQRCAPQEPSTADQQPPRRIK